VHHGRDRGFRGQGDPPARRDARLDRLKPQATESQERGPAKPALFLRLRSARSGYKRAERRKSRSLRGARAALVRPIGASSARFHRSRMRRPAKFFPLPRRVSRRRTTLSNRCSGESRTSATTGIELTAGRVLQGTPPGFRDDDRSPQGRSRTTIRATGRPKCSTCATRISS